MHDWQQFQIYQYIIFWIYYLWFLGLVDVQPIYYVDSTVTNNKLIIHTIIVYVHLLINSRHYRELKEHHCYFSMPLIKPYCRNTSCHWRHQKIMAYEKRRNTTVYGQYCLGMFLLCYPRLILYNLLRKRNWYVEVLN